jgi:hypothetical protein
MEKVVAGAARAFSVFQSPRRPIAHTPIAHCPIAHQPAIALKRSQVPSLGAFFFVRP